MSYINNLDKPEINYLAKKIFANVCVSDTGCWNWKLSTNSSGYGKINYKGKLLYTHRLSYFIWNRSLDKRDVCHTCDNRICCNPMHLFQGTRKENMNDALVKNRVQRGSDRHNTIFTEKDIVYIFNSSEMQKDIAKKYGVSPATIGKIKRRETWRHVTDSLADRGGSNVA